MPSKTFSGNLPVLLVTAFITILINGTITVLLTSVVMKEKARSKGGVFSIQRWWLLTWSLAQTLKESAGS